MQRNVLATLTGEGYSSDILRTYDLDVPEGTKGRETVVFEADMDIDADGANGQHGLPIAYRVDNRGTERLADIGYPRFPDEYSEGLICNPPGRKPIVFTTPEGVEFYASRTALRMPDAKGQLDPSIAVDAEFFPYVVVPPIVIHGTHGKVLGSLCEVQITHNGGKTWSDPVDAVVADVGPSKKNGEGSCELARQLGISGNPLSGGTDLKQVRYTIHVGVPAVVRGFQFRLQ